MVEIGQTRGNIGQLMKVKPLGCLAMIDEGELDWKIVAISLDDPKASLVNDIDDVEKHFPVLNLFDFDYHCRYVTNRTRTQLSISCMCKRRKCPYFFIIENSPN